jgi:hypothetical protein
VRRNALAAVAIVALVGVATLHASGAARHAGDQLDDAEKAQRAAGFAALQPVALNRVSPAEQTDAIAAMQLPDQDRLALFADLQRQRTRLAWLVLHDTHDEDGDVVSVTTSGFRRDVMLTKAPVMIAVPAPASGVINLTGLVDGRGGGITVGVASPTGVIPLPLMSVGQTIGIPISVRP